MGGAAGEAFTNTLASSGMPPADVLAREAIQNSVDAQAPSAAKVAVDFVARELTGDAKATFIKVAGIRRIQERAPHIEFNEPNCLTTLDNPDAPLRLLFVNDRNTTGLEGDPDDPDSKFYRFLLSLGDGGKEREERGTGGSYGFGKSVYSSNSSIQTIFAYSRTLDSNGRPLSVLFGCGYYRHHRIDENRYTGRAWFGFDQTSDHPHAQQVVDPLRNEAADELALALGFEERSHEDLGTSVLIVDVSTDVDTAGILRGVEDWWWPRLVSNLLDVRVLSADGAVELPRPRKREDLRPFLDAYEIAVGKSPPKPKVERRKIFNRMEGLAIGSAGFVVLEKQEDGDYVVGEERVDAVALIRSPLMVVAYYRRWQVGNPALGGAFVASEDIDGVLRAAEPPAHDRWDPEARRLQDQTGRKRQIVERVLTGIKRHLKRFQNEASPPPPPRPKRLNILERTLASYLSPNRRGRPLGTEPSPAPIHLSYVEEPRAIPAGGDDLRLRAVFTVRLKSDEEIEALKVGVHVTCPVMEDEQEGEALQVFVKPSVAPIAHEAKPGWSVFDLSKGTAIRIECETEPYNPSWTVKFVPEVEPVEGD